MDIGTIRVKPELSVWKYTKSGFRRVKQDLPALKVLKMYKKHRLLNKLIDTKDPRFIKGMLTPDLKALGARIDFLPDGTKVDKAFSLFAKNLVVHDESSHDHWDVLFQNPGGTWAYLYSIDKKEQHLREKYKKVELFEKHYPRLRANVVKALHDPDDHLALPMYTLLKTCMRVGNEVYYKTHRHKGLTTLKKKDVAVDGNIVEFDYLSKGGVPRSIAERFPPAYTERLQKKLGRIKKESFIFAKNGHPLRDTHFKHGFKRYCGVEFYPHIVRSYYATARTKEFLRTHKSISKEEAREFLFSIAEKLGHRKFDKKNSDWKENYTVTLNYYIHPDLAKKVQSIIR